MKYTLINDEEAKTDVEQYSDIINISKRVHEDLRISMEQADNGELIPMEDLLARY